jgi:hypothetical protein
MVDHTYKPDMTMLWARIKEIIADGSGFRKSAIQHCLTLISHFNDLSFIFVCDENYYYRNFLINN